MQGQPDQAYIGYIVTAIIVALVMFLRFRRMSKARPLKLELLWIVPALYSLVAALVLWQSVPHGIQWLYVALALVAGGLIGWRRGAMMRINIDPETHALNQQASPAAMLFIFVIIIIRQGLRVEATAMGLNAPFLMDLAVVFILGMFSITRLEMYLRAKRMLREHLGATFS